MKILNVRSKHLLIILLVLLLCGAVAAAVWYSRKQYDPETGFYTALETGLRQKGITCSSSETEGGVVTSQVISLDLASRHNLRAATTITQNGTSASTEEIANKTDDYVRYTKLSTQTKSASPQPDFSKVLNIWSKSGVASQTSTTFGRTVLGNCVVPLADFNAPQVSPLMAELRKNTVFKTNFAATGQAELDGTKARTYDVTVQPRPYIDFMIKVAGAYGLKDLQGIIPSDYDTKPSEHLKFYVDARGARLLRIDYTGRQHTVDFTNYGKVPQLTIPNSAVTPQELQKRLTGRK